MFSWSAKRRLLYGGGFILVLAIIFSIIYWQFFYVPPTCSDGLKNGSETGVDCGGACKNVCTVETLPPIVYWTKAFNVLGSTYNVGAYVENPNANFENPKATYSFKIYDEKNILLAERDGQISIPKNKKFLVFEPNFNIQNKKPKYVDFKFTSFSTWQKNTTAEPELLVTYSALLSTSTSPHILGTIENKSLQNIGKIAISTIVSDSKENAIAISQTVVDSLPKLSSADFVFTWPKPFDLGVEECSAPVDVALVLDRSGSMSSESVIPQEPFNTVKTTAQNFIKTLSENDRISVISFGDSATVSNNLSSNKDQIISAIDSISLGTTSEQTNIGDGLLLALNQLQANYDSNRKQYIVLLTDGLPTEPQKKGDKEYPKTYAKAVADSIATSTVSLYAIGLGKGVSEDFLKSLVTQNSQYFLVPTKEDLSQIYNKISSSLCTKKPSVVKVMYRII